MAKACPLYGKAIYMDCLECNEKLCKKPYKYKRVVIGIDQSYQNTGISVAADGKLKHVKAIDLSKLKSKREKRIAVKKELEKVISKVKPKAGEVVCVVERIRLHTHTGMSVDYIKAIGALIATISDVCANHSIETYSVDTRCWKSQIVGTSKPQANSFGVPPEKWPTIQWCIAQGFEDAITHEITGRKVKGTFVRDGKRYMYDNDAADSAAIAMFGFYGDPDKLHKES